MKPFLRNYLVLVFAVLSCSPGEEPGFVFTQVDFTTSLERERYVRGTPIPISIHIQSPRKLKKVDLRINGMALWEKIDFLSPQEFHLDTVIRLNPTLTHYKITTRVEDVAGNTTKAIELKTNAFALPAVCEKTNATSILLSLPPSTPAQPVYISGPFNEYKLGDPAYQLVPAEGMFQCQCVTVDYTALNDSFQFFTVNRGSAETESQDFNCIGILLGIGRSPNLSVYLIDKWKDLDCQ